MHDLGATAVSFLRLDVLISGLGETEWIHLSSEVVLLAASRWTNLYSATILEGTSCDGKPGHVINAFLERLGRPAAATLTQLALRYGKSRKSSVKLLAVFPALRCVKQAPHLRVMSQVTKPASNSHAGLSLIQIPQAAFLGLASRQGHRSVGSAGQSVPTNRGTYVSLFRVQSEGCAHLH